MKRRVGPIGILLLAGLLAGCAFKEAGQPEGQTKKQTVQQEKAEIPYDEPLPRDYEGTLSMWGWDEDYYRTVTEAFQKKYPKVEFDYTEVEHKDLPQKYETALISGGELPDLQRDF